MRRALLLLTVALIAVLGFAAPPAHADGIDWTSSIGGGKISWDQTATGALVGSSIPITQVAFTGGSENAVTGFICGKGSKCGVLAFTTGSFVSGSFSSGSITFAPGGSLTIRGSVTGGSVVTLVSATFLSDVILSKISGSTWSLNTANMQVTAIDPSVLALFSPHSFSSNGTFGSLVITFHVARNGSVVGKATSQDLFISAVPEPASMFMFGSGLLALGNMLRRRKK